MPAAYTNGGKRKRSGSMINELQDEGYIALAICIVRGVSPQHAFEILNNPTTQSNRKWTEEDIELVCEYKRQGCSYKEIAELMNTTRSTIQRMWVYWNKTGKIK